MTVAVVLLLFFFATLAIVGWRRVRVLERRCAILHGRCDMFMARFHQQVERTERTQRYWVGRLEKALSDNLPLEDWLVLCDEVEAERAYERDAVLRADD